MGFKGNALGGILHQDGGVQNKCPGGVWCRGFMSWGDTLILVISRVYNYIME